MELVIEVNKAALVERVCTRLEAVTREAIEQRGRCSWVLSGGSTPKALYERLAGPEWKSRFDWDKIVILFGDDRAVGPDDSLSNFKMAREALLQHVAATVHRLEGERPDLESAARDYAATIAELLPLDVVLNGLGSDGHTASLFPNSPQLHASGLVTATPVASLEPHVRRLTLTFEALNQARHSWFLVTGEDKKERVRQVMRAEKSTEEVPARGIHPQAGELVWFLDEAAAIEIA